jgi:hypothetical protein
VLKKDAFAKSTLLCQVHDSSLQFIGDSGAIGRLTTDSSENVVTLDLKGNIFLTYQIIEILNYQYIVFQDGNTEGSCTPVRLCFS